MRYAQTTAVVVPTRAGPARVRVEVYAECDAPDGAVAAHREVADRLRRALAGLEVDESPVVPLDNPPWEPPAVSCGVDGSYVLTASMSEPGKWKSEICDPSWESETLRIADAMDADAGDEDDE